MGDIAAGGSGILNRKLIRHKKLTLRLLVLTSLGPIYSGFLLFRIGEFNVTLVHLMFAITAVVVSLRLDIRRFDFRVATVLYVMILLELSHALFFGFGSEKEWIRSVVQFVLYSTVFLVVASSDLNRADLLVMAPWVRKCALFFGGMGILQSLLANISGFYLFLPSGLQASAYNPLSELRTGRFIPVYGMALEPSYYAIGLVTLLVLVLFLDASEKSKESERLSHLAVGVLLAGIVASFSMVGLLMAAVLLGTAFLFSGTTVGAKFKYVLLVSFLALIVSVSGIVEPIERRIRNISNDNSALIRVVAPIQLLAAPPVNTENFMLGTGLGMETRNAPQYYQIYRDVSLRPQFMATIKIHNILATVKFFQGWIGVLLYGVLLRELFLIPTGNWGEYTVISVFIVAFHFASGLYLYPSTWATFGLLTILHRTSV